MEKDEFVAIEKIREAWAGNRTFLAGPVRAQVDAQIIQASSPALRSVLFHDPAADLRQIKVPVLILSGSRDLQVSAEKNLPALTAAVAGNSDFAATVLPGLNHLLQKCSTCLVTEYSAIEETISTEALDLVSTWILRHT